MPEATPPALGDYSFAPAATAEDAVRWALSAAGECAVRAAGKSWADTQTRQITDTHLQRIGDALLARLTELGATGASAILDGADPTPPPAGAVLTPGQLWHRLVTATPDDRADLLGRLLAASGVGARCAAADHDGVLDQLGQAMGALAVERTTRAAAVRTLRDALAAAHPIVAYVSTGRRHVGVEPYPDGEARRVNAVIADLLDPPQQDGATP